MSANPIPGDAEQKLYANCMEEIKRRTHAINAFLTKSCTTPFQMTNIEFVCLQVRKILELIALASMTSHKEEYSRQHSKFAEKWRAKEILKDLEKLNPNFYPIPTEQVRDQKTGEVLEVRQITRPFLTKADFIDVYQQCSSLLHAANPFASPKPVSEIEARIPTWMSKIKNLLNHHQIQLYNSEYQLWVLMNANVDGKVHVYLFERIDDPPSEDEDWDVAKRGAFLNWVLRKKPEHIGICLDAEGWVTIEDLLKACNRGRVLLTREQLNELVRANGKHRFAFDENGLRIRVV